MSPRWFGLERDHSSYRVHVGSLNGPIDHPMTQRFLCALGHVSNEAFIRLVDCIY